MMKNHLSNLASICFICLLCFPAGCCSTPGEEATIDKTDEILETLEEFNRDKKINKKVLAKTLVSAFEGLGELEKPNLAGEIILQEVPEMKNSNLRIAILKEFLNSKLYGPEATMHLVLKINFLETLISKKQKEELKILLTEFPPSKSLTEALLIFCLDTDEDTKPGEDMYRICEDYIKRTYPGLDISDGKNVLIETLPPIAVYYRKLEKEKALSKGKVEKESALLFAECSRMTSELIALYRDKKNFLAIAALLENPVLPVALVTLKEYMRLSEVPSSEKTSSLNKILMRDEHELLIEALKSLNEELVDLKTEILILGLYETFREQQELRIWIEASRALRFLKEAKVKHALKKQMIALTENGELKDEKKELLLATVQALGAFQDAQVLQALEDLLDSSDDDIVAEVMAAVQNIDLPDLNNKLISLAGNTKRSPSVRSSAVITLYSCAANQKGSKNTDAGVKAFFKKILLDESLKESRNRAIKLQVLKGMGELGFPEFKLDLLKAMASLNDNIEKDLAFASLVKIAPDDAILEIIKRANPEDYYLKLVSHAKKDAGRFKTVLKDCFQHKRYKLFVRLTRDKSFSSLLSKDKWFKGPEFKTELVICLLLSGEKKSGQENLKTLIKEIKSSKEVAGLFELGEALFKAGFYNEAKESIKYILDNITERYKSLMFVKCFRLKIQCDLKILPKDKLSSIRKEISPAIKLIDSTKKEFKVERDLLIEIEKKLPLVK